MKPSLDELQARLAQANDLSQRIDLLNEFAWQTRYWDTSRLFTLVDEAHRLSTSAEFSSQPYERGLAYCLVNLGRYHVSQGEHLQARDVLQQALALLKKLDEPIGQLRAMNELGRLYSFMDDHAQAFSYYLQTLDLARQVGDDEHVARATHNIGYTHLRARNFQAALKYYQEGLATIEAKGDPHSLAVAYSGLAYVYYSLGDDARAIEYARKSAQQTHELGSNTYYADAVQVIGDTHRRMGQLDQARDLYLDALRAARLGGAKYTISDTLYRLGDTYRQQGLFEQALPHLTEALALADEINSPALQYECHDAWANYYKDTGDYVKALAHHEKFHQLKEKVFNENADTRLNILEITHQVETAKKEAEIYQLRAIELDREIQQRKKVEDALREMAMTDALTGLANRRQFFDVARYLGDIGRRYSHCLSAVMLDIDYFKQINDRYGHAAGDEVLRQLAGVIQGALRKTDVVCRYGGDEFAILMPETSLSDGFVVADRIRTLVEAHVVKANDVSIHATCSVGVASNENDRSADADALLTYADRSLYAAKQAGRNRTRLYETE